MDARDVEGQSVLRAANYADGFHLAYQQCKPGVFILDNKTIPEERPFLIDQKPFHLLVTDGTARSAGKGRVMIRRASFVIEVDPMSKSLKAVHMTSTLRHKLGTH